MEKSTLDTSRSGYREDVFNHSRKSKKRSSKKNSALGPWMNSMQNNQNNDTMSGMEYQPLLWQPNMQQNFPDNGQRLFATTSDPSMCGYAQMPMTYAMEPVSLPMYRVYQPVPFSGIRTVHNRPRRHCNQNPMNLSMKSTGNGYSSLQENGVGSPLLTNYQNGDCASLPPINTANKISGMNGDELNSEHRRYSDPGLGSAETPELHTQSEDSDSEDSGSSITTIGRSNKLVLSLIEQMTELKKSNSQLFKELNETKSELGSMKAKLAQCKYSNSTDYQPGMLSDFIREIRQANKTFEEGLVLKVKSMVEEKLNQKSLEVSNLNNQIEKLIEEKEEACRRIAKLEEEVTTLKLNANNEGREIAAFEEETLALRRELQEARASKCEGHIGKCVTSVTPIATFDTTQTYVTSTPVRTALSNTQSLNSALSSLFLAQHITALTHSRTAELAHQCDTDKTNHRNVPSNSPTSMENQDPTSSGENQSSIAITTSLDVQDITLEETSSIASEMSLENRTEEIIDQNTEETIEMDVKKDRGETDSTSDTFYREKLEKETIDSTVEENTDNATMPLSEKRTKGSKRNEELSRSHQRTGSKKSRKKKSNFLSKKLFSEADKERNETDARRTVSENEDRSLIDDETRRAITDVPEVAVVGGGSFVPKDLCSTGILTSRVLTAPSRATYTTAYI